MAEAKDVLQGVLLKALNLSDEETASLYDEAGQPKDDALDKVLSIHSEKQAKHRERVNKDRDEKYRQGWKESAEAKEKALKAVGIEALDTKGADEWAAKIKQLFDDAKAPSDLPEDKVKTHPLYLKLEREASTKVQEKENEWDAKWKERDAKEQRERILSDVKGKAKVILDGLKPNLPDDPKKAANQLKYLFGDLEALTYEVDGEELLIKDKEGKRLENASGHPLKLEDLVKQTAEQYYDFQVSEKKGSAGDPSKGAVKEGFKLQKPATREAYGKEVYRISEDATMKPDEKAKALADLKTLAPEFA